MLAQHWTCTWDAEHFFNSLWTKRRAHRPALSQPTVWVWSVHSACPSAPSAPWMYNNPLPQSGGPASQPMMRRMLMDSGGPAAVASTLVPRRSSQSTEPPYVRADEWSARADVVLLMCSWRDEVLNGRLTLWNPHYNKPSEGCSNYLCCQQIELLEWLSKWIGLLDCL